MLAAGLLLLAAAGCESVRPAVDSYPQESAHRITVNGVEIHYFDFHPEGTQTPIVWLHGYSGTAFETSYIQGHLGPRRRLIAPDLPGGGYSEKPEIEYTLDVYLEFVERFIDALDLDSYVLVGHSMGGLIASRYASERPDGLERLILIAPYRIEGAAGPIAEFLSHTGVLVDYGLELHNETIVELGMRFNVFYDPDLIPPDLVNYISASTFHTPNGVGALASITRNMIGVEHDPAFLEKIAVPSLIVWGAEDRVLDFRYSAPFNRLIPGSTLQAMPRTGHLPHVERPAVTADIIRDFLEQDETDA